MMPWPNQHSLITEGKSNQGTEVGRLVVEYGQVLGSNLDLLIWGIKSKQTKRLDRIHLFQL
jgi:hypothetical protein